MDEADEQHRLPEQPALPDEPASPAVRPSDAERDQVVARLRTAAGEGRITFAELSDRIEEAFRATDGVALERLTADLPAPAPAPTAAPGVERVVGVLSGTSRTGRWRPRRRTTAVAVVGSCLVDLCDAVFDEPEIEVKAVAVLGGVEVLVPEGVHAEVVGWAVLGGKDHRVRGPVPDAGAPTVRVVCRAVLGGVTVRTPRFHGRRP